jgi:hypothetical protein
MTVYVLERVLAAVADRHELDHAERRMHGMTRRLLELAPAPIVRFDLEREPLHELRDSNVANDVFHAFDADVLNHGGRIMT